jgi:tRNA modification GTPase
LTRQTAEHLTAARLTADLSAAIACIGVHGPGADTLVQQFVTPPQRRSQAVGWEMGRVHFGVWRSPALQSGEHVVVCRTDEQTVEINCHGGQAVSRRILDDLATAGCQLQTAWEWQARASCQMDGNAFEWRTHATAERELCNTLSPRAALILLDQANGALDQTLQWIADDLRDQRLSRAAERVRRLLDLSPLGLHLSKPWRIVLSGPPNVGKSSLINALSGQHRAIVHDHPGTTRDWLEVQTLVDGWPVSLTDTAGIRQSAENDIEAEGIRRSYMQIQRADLILLVVDASQGWTTQHQDLYEDFRLQEKPLIIVVNKIDLTTDSRGALRVPPAVEGGAGVEVVSSSCAVERGTVPLLDAMTRALALHLPTVGEGLPFTVAQVAALQTIEPLIATGKAVEALQHLAGIN